MNTFSPSYFFDLSGYTHATLFKADEPVWNTLRNLEKYFARLQLGSIEITIPAGAFLVDSHLITIEKGAIVEPGAYIKGPCYIGKGTTIRHGAYIRGNVIAGENCVIGHDSELKNCILLNGAHAAHFAYVGDSILGNKVNLGAGTKCANLKLQGDEVFIRYDGGIIKTGLRKFGAIIGDHSQTGCNTVTNPGTLIGKEVFCGPLLSISGFIPSQSYVKATQNLVIERKK